MRFTGRTAVQWARESNDGRRIVGAVEAGLVLVVAAALCGVDVGGNAWDSLAGLRMAGGSGVGEHLLT